MVGGVVVCLLCVRACVLAFRLVGCLADAAVSYVDEHIGALINVLEKQGVLQDTIIVV